MDILQLSASSATSQDKRRRELYEKRKKDASKKVAAEKLTRSNSVQPSVPLLSEETLNIIQQKTNEVEDDEETSSEPNAMKMLRYIASLKPYQ